MNIEHLLLIQGLEQIFRSVGLLLYVLIVCIYLVSYAGVQARSSLLLAN